MIVVSNSSPLIVFGRLDRFDLLKTLFRVILISEEVHREVVVQGKGLAGAKQTEKADWIQVRGISNEELRSKLASSYNLGAGEATTIVLAKELSADIAVNR